MQKHLLLTISDDKSASFNLRFVRGFFSDFCDLKITLFYVAPRHPDWELDAELQPEQAARQEIEALKKSHGQEYLDYAWEWITRQACDPDKVEKKLAYSRKGTVQEIIEEARKGLYDAVVLGRRGLSWFEELVEDSVSHKILWTALDFPIWVCRRPPDDDAKRENVLLAIDGTAPSIRMADHVGFMLGPNEKHQVTIFNVGANDDKESEKGMEKAIAALLENGVPEERILAKTVGGSNVVDAILTEADKGNYAVIATGRSTGSPSGMERMFPSSVTTRLLRKVTDQALWISK